MRRPSGDASGRMATGAGRGAGLATEAAPPPGDVATRVSVDASGVEAGAATLFVGKAGRAVGFAFGSNGMATVFSKSLSASVTWITVVALVPLGPVTRTACAPGGNWSVARPSSSAAAMASEPRKTVLPAGRL